MESILIISQPNINKAALLVFAKAPVAGQTKTRLIPALGALGAAQLHEQLVLHTLNNLVKPESWDTLLWSADQTQHDFFRQCLVDYDLKLFSQQGEDLGQRMFHAANTCLQDYDAICLVGTDCPVLEIKDIAAAFAALANADIVFNPAEDGGYVLIAAKSIDQAVFENIDWGTETVMQKTLVNIQRIGFQVSLLRMLWDVDVPEDLKKLDGILKLKTEN